MRTRVTALVTTLHWLPDKLTADSIYRAIVVNATPFLTSGNFLSKDCEDDIPLVYWRHSSSRVETWTYANNHFVQHYHVRRLRFSSLTSLGIFNRSEIAHQEWSRICLCSTQSQVYLNFETTVVELNYWMNECTRLSMVGSEKYYLTPDLSLSYLTTQNIPQKGQQR